MNAVFLSSIGIEELGTNTRYLLNESVEQGRTIFASPAQSTDSSISGLEIKEISTDRPIELQSKTEWLADCDQPVLIALGVSVEPAAISHRYPVIWIEDTETPHPLYRAASLAHRSALVAGRQELQRLLQIPDSKFIDVNSINGSSVWIMGPSLSQYQPNSKYHEALSAESFMRYEQGRPILDQISGISTYKRARLIERLRLEGEHRSSPQPELLVECAESGDQVGCLILGVMDSLRPPVESTTPRELGTLESAPQILLSWAELSSCETLDEVLENEVAKNFRVQPSSIQHLVVVQALSKRRTGQPEPPDLLRSLRSMIIQSGAIELLTAENVIDFGGDIDTPQDFFDRIIDHGQRPAAMAARVEKLKRLARSEKLFARADVEKLHHNSGMIEIEELLAETASLIEEVDGSALHPSLWRTGFDYWQSMSSEALHFEPHRASPPPPNPLDLSTVTGEDISQLNATASKALTSENASEAAQLYDKVRLLCMQQDPILATTERAARLNAGWALWKAGRPRAVWAPYITSVLEEIGPGPSTLILRGQLVQLIDHLTDPAVVRIRHIQSMQIRLAQFQTPDTSTSGNDLSQLIAEIDALASHAGLWHSGLTYWRKITGEEWPGKPVDPAPPTIKSEGINTDLNTIQGYDSAAQKAIKRRLHRRAAKFLERVRVSCQHSDPPVLSTERAARLNLGWVLSRMRRPPNNWRPYITSVLDEVGPGSEYAALRAQAVGAIDTGPSET